MALRTEVKGRSSVEIVPEQPPAYDSTTADKAEHAVQRIESNLSLFGTLFNQEFKKSGIRTPSN